MTSHDDPNAIRADIERTRAELSTNVDTLTETANPKNIAGRQVDKVKGAARGVREHLMGAADDPTDSGTLGERSDAIGDKAGALADKASGAVDSVSNAPGQVKQKARGNPLAAGLIAFGVGYLISSAIPSTQREQEAVEKLADKAAPLKDKLSETAQELGDRLREPAQDAVESVRSTAGGAVENVKNEGSSARDDVTEQVQSSRDAVGNSTS